MRMSMSTTVSLCFSVLLRALFLQGPGAVFLVHGTRGRGPEPVPRDDKERFRVPESHDAPARHTSSTTSTTSSSSSTRPSRAAGESEFNVSRRTSRAAPPGGRRAHMRSGLLLDEPPPPSPGQCRPFAAVLAQCGPPGQQDAYDHDQQMAFAAAADESARKFVDTKQDQETAQEAAAVSCAELTELNQMLHQAICAGGGVARGRETISGVSDSSPGTGPRGTDAVAAPAQEQALSPVTSAGEKAGGEQEPEGGIASPSPAFLSRSLHKFLAVGYCDDHDDHLHQQRYHGKNGDEELYARGRRWLVCRRVQMLHEKMNRIASGGCAAAEDHCADEAKSAVQVEELHRLRGELASALRIDATNDPTWIAARRIHAALTEAEEAHLSPTTGPDPPRSSSARLFRTSSTPPAAPRLSVSSSSTSSRDHSELKRVGSRHSLCSSAPTTAGSGGSGSCTRRNTETETLNAESVLLLQGHLADMQDNFSTPSSGSAASPEMHSMISGEALDQLDADADELELTPAAGTAQWTPRHQTPRRGQHSAGFLQRAADAPPASSSSSFLGLPPWGPPSSYARHDVTSSRLSDVPENPAGRSFLSDGTTASDLNRCDKAGGAPPGTMAGRSFGEASDNVEEWQRMQTPEDDLSTAVHPWVSLAQDQHQALPMTNANPSSLGTVFNHTGHRETTDQRLQPAGGESANAFWSWTNAGRHQGDYNHECQPDMDGNMQPVHYGNAANDQYQYPCPPCYMLTSIPVVVPVTGVVVVSPQQLQLAAQQPEIPAIPRGARRIDSLSLPPSAVGTTAGGTAREDAQMAGAHDGTGTDAQLQRSWWQWGWGH